MKNYSSTRYCTVGAWAMLSLRKTIRSEEVAEIIANNGAKESRRNGSGGKKTKRNLKSFAAAVRLRPPSIDTVSI